MSLFSKSALELIRTRASWRRFQIKPLKDAERAKIHDCFFALPKLPFPGQTRFQWVNTFQDNPGAVRALGTYGNIVGATEFIAGAVTRAPYDLENYAYHLEHLILIATDLGLGTCWLGGSFSRSDFSNSVRVRPEERIPAVTPVGYVTTARSFRDRILRWQAGSAQRKPWSELFCHGTWDNRLVAEQSGPYSPVIEMVRLAPSASNRQPWRILKESGKSIFHFYLQRNTLYTQVAKTLMQAEDIQRLDMGIALCHFELAARELNLPGQWSVRSGTPLLAKAEYLVTWMGEN